MVRSPRTLLLPLLLSLFIDYLYAQNLVCNGDFQNYPIKSTLNIDGYLQLYDIFPNDYKCWYASSCGSIQVLQTIYGTGTKGAQFIIYLICSIKLCQNLILTAGEKYLLSYDVTSFPLIQTGNITAILNNKDILTITNNNYLEVSHGEIIFLANSSKNKLCFKAAAKTLPNVTKFNSYTPILDNVVVQKFNYNQSYFNHTSYNSTYNNQVEEENVLTIRVDFQMQIDDIQGILHLNSKLQCTQEFLRLIESTTKIFIEDELQNQVSYFLTKENYMQMEVKCQRSYNIQTIKAVLPSTIKLQSQLLKLIFFFNGNEILLFIGPSWMINSVQNVQPFAEAILDIVTKGYNLMRTFFVSYLFLGLFNFFNLTLIYPFLNLSSMPRFARNFMERLIRIFYLQNSLKSTFTNLVGNNEISKHYLSFDNFTASPQKVTMSLNNFAWFGSYGVTYNFFNNNIEILITLVFLLLKMIVYHFLIMGIEKCLLSCSKKRKKQKYIVLFGKEIIPLAPTMIISCMANLLSMGSANYLQGVNNGIQILWIFLLLSVVILFVLQSQIRVRTKKQVLSEKKKRMISENKISLMKHLLILIVPITISIEQGIGFFTVVSLTFFFFFLVVVANFRNQSIKMRVFNGLQCFLLAINHLAYVFLFSCEKQKNKIVDWQVTVVGYVGFTLIFVIICGACLNILQFLVSIIQWLVKVVKKIRKYCKQRVQKQKGSEDIDGPNKSCLRNQDKQKQKCIFIPVEALQNLHTLSKSGWKDKHIKEDSISNEWENKPHIIKVSKFKLQAEQQRVMRKIKKRKKIEH